MPTGYTADVATGKVADLRTFVLRCARAFGATIMQRDDPSSDPPHHREPTDYYTKELKREREELEALTLLSSSEAERGAHAAREADLAQRAKYRAEQDATRGRYETMIEEVKAWNPPTENHSELKIFMLKQLNESIRFDCAGDFWRDDPPRLTGEEWRAKRIEDLTRSIKRHGEHEAEELEGCATANKWIDALYASLDSAEISA